MLKNGLCAALGLLALGQVSLADIKVAARLRGSTDVPTDIAAEITVGNHVSITTQQLLNAVNPTATGGNIVLWVYDEASTTAVPTLDIGSITINYSPGTLPLIRLIVAPAPEAAATLRQADFATSPTVPMPPGAVSLGPITITGDPFPGIDERGYVSAAIAVSGDVGNSNNTNPRDKIDVGVIYRLEALGRPNSLTGRQDGGHIYADLNARETDNLAFSTHDVSSGAIGVITAYYGIDGKVQASGTGSTDTAGPASINRIVITGDALVASGIRGDILAERGDIGFIYTSGQIGASAAKVQIRAGGGIREIVATNGNTSNILNKDFFADVWSNLAGTTDTFALVNRAIFKIQTAGNFVGNIDTDFVRFDPESFNDIGVNWGIIVGGSFTGDIHVRHSVLLASIGAATFAPPTSEHPDQGHIIIDHGLDGSIVATADTGEIPFLSVGLSPNSENTTFGFVGTNCEPQTKPFLPWSVIVPSGRFPAAAPNLPVPDSVIAAHSIGTVTISSMKRVEFEKRFSPRIEADTIGSLQIQDMRQGVVWSGHLEYQLNSNGNPLIDSDTNRPVLQDPLMRSNDYSHVSSMQIGCVSPGADLWIRQPGPAVIENHLLGELYMPAINSGELIKIKGKLGIGAGVELVDECLCLDDTGGGCELPASGGWPDEAFPPASDGSPRNIGVAAVGAVRLATGQSLSGQVIVEHQWKGDVIVGDDSGSPTVLAPGFPQPHMAPYYSEVSAALGGGAVGLAPFHVHEQDCYPPHDAVGTSAGLSEDQFNGTAGPNPFAAQTILVRFYGPIKKKTAANWASHVRVRARPYPPGCDGCIGCTPPIGSEPVPGSAACQWADVSAAFNVLGPGEGTWSDKRSIGIKVKNGYHVAPGIYMVSPVEDDSVRCDNVTGNPAVVWPWMCADDDAVPQSFYGAMGYGFVVSGDCDHDGIPDQIDCVRSSCVTLCDVADFNHSGSVSVQDLFDFLNAYFGACMGQAAAPCNGDNADVNGSGAITVQDIFDYLTAFFSNCT